MLHGLDLFSGIGGISIGLKNWVKPVAYCEIERYAQSVLLSRIADGQLHRAPIWDDVTSLTSSMLPSVDIIYGGFPCQDISFAGLGAGLGGERSGLFHHIARLTEELSPKFVFLENVPAIRSRGLSEVAQTFTEIGYDCRWTCISAAFIGAPHKRERWFLLAHANGNVNRSEKSRSDSIQTSVESFLRPDNSTAGQLDRTSSGFWGNAAKQYDAQLKADFWKTEPGMVRMVNGLPQIMDRNKSLGNAVVPQQVEAAFRILIGGI